MTQYLILHKVRGEPSFDCAEEIEPGMWITNSGYRAYPVQSWRIDGSDGLLESLPIADVPGDWPDHFQVIEERAVAKKGTGIDISGLIRNLLPKVKVHRRF